MGNLDNGGYAFPIPNADFQTFAPGTVEEYKRIQSGMTLRDYFAAKAMQAMISNNRIIDNDSDGAVNYASSAAYKFADAMLKARE
ncbi:hypothetical protein [Enterobacter hormaechei]|uniref:hypothetical protein n=1 Tax=Enterobacter hormaechei TaxID=158836 RepID=UPI002739F307|nr:hypothetical protein [Enterobacter hormaechei]MDZ5681668.1 hypothetical protein [Enterobacter hormaechei]WLP13251.1 hypothetical protein Q8Z25_11495 [Enterobacter hormaechei]HCD9772878.1 hypothetical protein [Enterobacter hormaechei]HCE3973769.1 hypothetical protein [Enterobacter hormaechei]